MRDVFVPLRFFMPLVRSCMLLDPFQAHAEQAAQAFGEG